MCVFYVLPSRKLNIYVRQSFIDMEILHNASKKSANGTKLWKKSPIMTLADWYGIQPKKTAHVHFCKQSLSTALFSCIVFLNTDKGL